MKTLRKLFVVAMSLMMLLTMMPMATGVAWADDNTIYVSAEGNDETGEGTINNPFKTLQKAIASATDGTNTTIKMMYDETFADNETVTIPAGKNIVLDLNGKTITGKNLKTSSWAFLTNNGILTITDNSDDHDGKITSSTEPDTDGYSGHYTVKNKNTLTVENGTIEETSGKVGGGNNLKWALRNEASANQKVTLTINGGTVIGEYNAISNYVYDNTSECICNINGGEIKSTGRFSPMTMQIAGGTTPKLEINIKGGNFTVENVRNTNENGNAIIYCDDQSHSVTDISNMKFSISGGKFNTYNTGMIVQFDDFKTETIKPANYMSAGIMHVAIDEKEIAAGYECVSNTDAETKEAYPYMIGEKKIAQIGNKTYPSLTMAVNEAKSGDTIVMLADVTGGSGNYGNAITKKIAIDLNGHEISGAYSYGVFYVYGGNLTVEDAAGKGKIENTRVNCEGIDLAKGGKLTVNGGTVIGQYAGAYIYEGDTHETITVNGGKVIGNYGIFLDKNDEVTVNGGNVEGKNYFAVTTNGQLQDFSIAPVVNINGGHVYSEDAPAMYLPAAGITNITGGKIEGYTAIGIKSGILNISGGEIIGSKNDIELSDGSSSSSGIGYDGSAIVIDSNIAYAGKLNVNISGGTIKGTYAYAIHEIGDDKSQNIVSINVTSNDAKIYGGNSVKGTPFNFRTKSLNDKVVSLTGGYYTGSDTNFYVGWDGKTGEPTTKPISNLVAPGYQTIVLDGEDQAMINEGYAYKIGKRTASDSNNKVVVDTTEDIPKYYGSATDLQDAINNVVEANQEKINKNKEVNKTTITVTNDEGIKAEIDDTVIIVAKTNNDNDVKADPGYVLNGAEEDATNGTTTYTASALEIGYGDTNKTTENKGTGTTETKQTEKRATVADNVSVSTAVQEIINNALTNAVVTEKTDAETKILEAAQNEASKINQGVAAKALNDGTNQVVRNEASGTDIIAAKNVSVFVDTYYQTEVKKDETGKTNVAEKSFTLDITPMYQAYATIASVTNSTTVNDLQLGEDSAKIGKPKKLEMTGKIVTMKVRLPEGFVNSTADKVYVKHTKGDKSYYYNATLVEEESVFYAVFSNPDGFSEFEFSRESLAPNNNPGYHGGSFDYEQYKKIFEEAQKKQEELANQQVVAEKQKAVQAALEEIRIRANSKYVKNKGKYATQVYATVLKGNTRLEELKEEGYKVEYTFYRSTKKNKEFKKMFTTDGMKYTNTYGIRGQMYYYKAVLWIYDTDGNLMAHTLLKQCKYGNREYRGYKY